MTLLVDIGEKHPDVAGLIEFDFSNWLGTEDVGAITEVKVYKIVTDGAEVDVTSSMYEATSSTISGKSVFLWIQGGTHNERYIVKCKITSSVNSATYVGLASFLVYDDLEEV